VKRTTEPSKKKEPEVDLFEFDEPAPASTAAPAKTSALTSLGGGANDDDEFDDFQSAAPATEPTAHQPSLTSSLPPPIMAAAPSMPLAAPKPVSAPQQANLSGMVAMSSISPPPSSTASPAGNFSAFSTPLTAATLSPAAQAPKPAGYQASGPNYFSSVQAATAAQPAAAKPGGSAAAGKSTGGDAFGALWSQASVGIKKNTQTGPGPTIGQLAKEKSSAGIWGAPAPSTTANTAGGNKPLGNGLDDLLG